MSHASLLAFAAPGTPSAGTGCPGSGSAAPGAVAYILGGPLPAGFREEVAAGLRPCPEFLRFAERTGGPLLWEEAGGNLLRRGAALARRVVAGGYRAVVTSGEDVGIPLALALCLRRSPVAVLVQVHGHYLDGRKFALLAPALRRLPRLRLLCLSEALRDRLVREHGFDAARCRTVGYGADLGFFDPAARPPPPGGTPLLLAAGQANRDWPTLMEAVRGLPVRLRVAAASPWMDRPDQAPADLPPNVEFRPAEGYTGLRALYAEARAVVVPMHPSGHACGYAVIAEAMAMGRPVVATRLAAPCDFLVEGEHGACVPAHDVPTLRAALARLAEDPALAARQGAAARARMEDGFGLDALCARIEAHLPLEAVRAPGAAGTGERVFPPGRRRQPSAA